MDFGFNLEIRDVDTVSLLAMSRCKYGFKDSENFDYSNLQEFLTEQGTLDAAAIRKTFFPNVNADIFVSYSHYDADNALAIAGWLKEKLKVNVFVDYSVWGSLDNLLQVIDQKYCRTEDNEYYCYEKRNLSTSYLHLLLNSALMEMINKCKCIIFLNTKKSIFDNVSIKDGVHKKTESPWIYSELLMSKFLQNRMVIKKARAIAEDTNTLKMEFDVNMDHLKTITLDDLVAVQKKRVIGADALTCLQTLYYSS